MKAPLKLPYEIAPGIFDTSTPEMSFELAYRCESYNDGNSATIPKVGMFEFSGYESLMERLSPSQQKQRIEAALAKRSYPHNRMPASEATRANHLFHFDSRVSGYVGELLETASNLENTGKRWQKYQKNAEERRETAKLFLFGRVREITGLETYFDDFDYSGKQAAKRLQTTAAALSIRATTQRRLNVYDTGQYIASRRGTIWVAINDSRMSDMPYFNFMAPLAGIALADLSLQERATYKDRLITPVVIGTDNAPYLAPLAHSLPFTLRRAKLQQMHHYAQ